MLAAWLCRYKLWTYSVWRRLLVLPGLTVWNMMLGNTAAGGLGLRLLGARLGKCTFSAGLECSEPEALQLGDYMSRSAPLAVWQFLSAVDHCHKSDPRAFACS